MVNLKKEMPIKKGNIREVLQVIVSVCILVVWGFGLNTAWKHIRTPDVVTCYTIDRNSLYSDITTGKHPSWIVIARAQNNDTGQIEYLRVNQSNIERGSICYTKPGYMPSAFPGIIAFFSAAALLLMGVGLVIAFLCWVYCDDND